MLRLAGFLRVFGIRVVDRAWCTDPSSHAISPAAEASSLTWPHTGSGSRADTAARSAADASAATDAVGWLQRIGSQRISGYSELGQSRRSYHGRFSSKPGIVISYYDCRRCDLFARRPGEVPPRRGQLVLVSSSAASPRLLLCNRQSIRAGLAYQ